MKRQARIDMSSGLLQRDHRYLRSFFLPNVWTHPRPGVSMSIQQNTQRTKTMPNYIELYILPLQRGLYLQASGKDHPPSSACCFFFFPREHLIGGCLTRKPRSFPYVCRGENSFCRQSCFPWQRPIPILQLAYDLP